MTATPLPADWEQMLDRVGQALEEVLARTDGRLRELGDAGPARADDALPQDDPFGRCGQDLQACAGRSAGIADETEQSLQSAQEAVEAWLAACRALRDRLPRPR
jgi:hypothetical protein